MATTAEIKNGLCIEFNHDIYQFMGIPTRKAGQGNIFVRCRMKACEAAGFWSILSPQVMILPRPE